MSESLENLVTVLENIETLKGAIVALGGEMSTEGREELTLSALRTATEATTYGLFAMRSVIHGD